MEGRILNMNTGTTAPKFTFITNFSVMIRDREVGQRKNLPENMPRWSTWFKDGSKTEHGTGAGVGCAERNLVHSYRFGQYTSVFH